MQDNQTATVSIKMTTQTPAGMTWEGEVVITGPFDLRMIDQAIGMSDQLAERATRQAAINDRVQEAKARELESIVIPKRSGRRRKTVMAEVDKGQESETQDLPEDITEDVTEADTEANTEDIGDDLPF
jgi:hypothetical protein